MKCKNLTWSGTIRFLHGLFARFGIADKILSDNGTQFTAKELKDFCIAFSDCTHPYCITPSAILLTGRKTCWHFQPGIKKFGRKRIRWRYPPTFNSNSGLSPVELMFPIKVRSEFNKLLPHEKLKKIIKKKNRCKILYTRRKFFI